MTRLGLLRHWPTAWNVAHRLQGRRDLPLTAEAEAELAELRLPCGFAAAVWHVSPLDRARRTAALLGARQARAEPRLIEMDYGSFEGQRLEDLRRRHGEALRRNEARGLDFLPPGGESPRQVQARLLPWLKACAEEGGCHLAVTHKGVIRAVLALAFAWQMRDKPPVRLNWRALHLFTLTADGEPRPERMNLPLERR